MDAAASTRPLHLEPFAWEVADSNAAAGGSGCAGAGFAYAEPCEMVLFGLDWWVSWAAWGSSRRFGVILESRHLLSIP